MNDLDPSHAARPSGRRSPLVPDELDTRDLRFVRRIHVMRTLGLGLGFPSVASVLLLQHVSPLVLLFLAANAFLWPHLARFVAERADSARRAEYRNLMLDSMLGGVWIAAMHFNLLPAVLIATMLSADKLAVGGLRLTLVTTAALGAACVVTSAALGFPVDVETPMSVVVASIPLLIVYPLALSNVMRAMSATMRLQNRRLAQINSTDELTGLVNRRQGHALAAFALASHRRDGRPAVLAVIDIDHFKEVNDRYGHPAGDEVLRGVASVLRECTRATDTAARLSGDEFLLVLPETDLLGAAELASRIRVRLASIRIESAPELRCTVSIGAAEVQRQMVDVEDWIQKADAALYRAKNAGRDRLVCSPVVPDFVPPARVARPSGVEV
jgi:diguanylate cyclase